MKIVIAGNWNWPHYEEAFSNGLIELGHEVLPFKNSIYFKGFFGKYYDAIPIPSIIFFRLNRDIINFLNDVKPDVFLAWRCIHFLPSTIKAINNMGILTVSYNNDDPFGNKIPKKTPWHHVFLWYWYKKDLKHFKRNFFYRFVNILEAKQNGAEHADLLMSYFIPKQSRPINLNEEETKRYGCDIVFVGHYEPDGREIHMKALAQSGLSVKLYGGGYWSEKVLGEQASYYLPVEQVVNDEYTKALCGAKVCLVFLSKLNRDTYTRRCFEIPACGKVMLAERTTDLMQMFIEDKEACFFSSTEELITKAKWLINNPEIVEKISQAGMRRVWKDGHDVKSRAAYFMNAITIKNISN